MIIFSVSIHKHWFRFLWLTQLFKWFQLFFCKKKFWKFQDSQNRTKISFLNAFSYFSIIFSYFISSPRIIPEYWYIVSDNRMMASLILYDFQELIMIIIVLDYLNKLEFPPFLNDILGVLRQVVILNSLIFFMLIYLINILKYYIFLKMKYFMCLKYELLF
jgi:hypothetical protein